MNHSASSREGRGPVHSVRRAAQLLKTLLVSPDGKHLTELARLIGVHKSTALRLLRTLQAEGFVRYDTERAHYAIAPALWFHAAPALPVARSYEAAVQQVLQELAERTGATTILFVPDPSYRIAVPLRWGVPPVLVRLDPASAPQAPMHTIAAGKCFLAGLSQPELDQWMAAGLRQMTPTTVTSPEKLRAEIARVRAQGFATNRGEAIASISALSVAIPSGSGRPAAALSVAAVSPTLSQAQARTWLPLLRGAAEALGALFSGPRLGALLDPDEARGSHTGT